MPRGRLVRRTGTATETRLTDALTRTAPDLLRYLQRRLPSDDAADALGEVMMTAWRRLDAMPGEAEEVRMWLFGIARHATADAQRGGRRRHDLGAQLREVARVSPGKSPAADDGADVRDAIARLSPDLAELVRLIHWDDFTISAAAALLTNLASTARTRYQRARAELHAALTGTAPRTTLDARAHGSAPAPIDRGRRGEDDDQPHPGPAPGRIRVTR